MTRKEALKETLIALSFTKDFFESYSVITFSVNSVTKLHLDMEQIYFNVKVLNANNRKLMRQKTETTIFK